MNFVRVLKTINAIRVESPIQVHIKRSNGQRSATGEKTRAPDTVIKLRQVTSKNELVKPTTFTKME
jgi:hypothetical protein